MFSELLEDGITVLAVYHCYLWLKMQLLVIAFEAGTKHREGEVKNNFVSKYNYNNYIFKIFLRSALLRFYL